MTKAKKATSPPTASNAPEITNEDALAFLQRQPANSAAAIITDPPYCSGGALPAQMTRSNSDRYFRAKKAENINPSFAGDSMSERNYLYFMREIFLQATRIVGNGVIFCFTDWRMWATIYDAASQAGICPKGMGVWHKPGGRPRRNGFWCDTELIYHGEIGKPVLAADCYIKSIYSEPPTLAKNRLHQTEKPLNLLGSLLAACPPGRIIDPFAGSASTLIAAHNAGRPAAGCEIDANYFAVARRRLAANKPLPLPPAAKQGKTGALVA